MLKFKVTNQSIRFFRQGRAAVIIIAVFIAATALYGCQGSKGVQGVSDLRGGETRQTLSPASFTDDTTRRAYQVAKDIPEVLDSLHCYCECKKHFGHKSLLTCYVDEHAVHCDVCQDEAFMAAELHKKGMDIKSIREEVDRKFSGLP